MMHCGLMKWLLLGWLLLGWLLLIIFAAFEQVKKLSSYFADSKNSKTAAGETGSHTFFFLNA